MILLYIKNEQFMKSNKDQIMTLSETTLISLEKLRHNIV